MTSRRGRATQPHQDRARNVGGQTILASGPLYTANVPAHDRWDQGFDVSFTADARPLVRFIRRSTACRIARQASENTRQDMELVQTREGWAYRPKEA